MAKKKQNPSSRRKGKGLQDTSKMITNTFSKGLNKDSDPSFVQEGMWTHAINIVNNTKEGDASTLSNESSNFLCATAGKTMPTTVTDKFIIGAVYLYSDKWVIFTVGHDGIGQRISSEVGLLEEDTCTYREIVQDACLNFDKRNLIFGASREEADCSWGVYWCDGYNPDRYLNIGDPKLWPSSSYSWMGTINNMNYYSDGTDKLLWPGVQWNETSETIDDCDFVTPTNTLNCVKTRLARLMKTPCLTLKLGQSGGTLANGTYFALIAYTIKGQKVTDYFSQSNYQFIYTVKDQEGSLTLDLDLDNESFDEFQLVLVEATNQQTVATQMGFYSTDLTRIEFDNINPTNIKIPLEQLPIQTPVFETTDQMTDVNGYLLRVGPRSKFDFNYQPLANLIRVKWASVEYPADYYMKGGNKTNYMRDEVYTFYIRWVYDTGDKSSSYHIPGRAPKDFLIPTGGTQFETEQINNDNALATDDKVFEIYNTATQSTYPTALPDATLNSNNQWVLDDGGVLLAVGEMGYWESSEEYPDDRPDIWNPSSYCWTGAAAQIPGGATSGPFDLCGKKIRHHKFPECFLNNSNSTNALHFKPSIDPGFTSDEYAIRLMGAIFEDITLPKDQNGNDIEGIVGYEILRGSREGNKTIVAKGMVNNLRTYELPETTLQGQDRIGLYPNYPYNTIKPIGHTNDDTDHNYRYNDPYIKNDDENGDVVNQDIPTEMFTFHSPDANFRAPYLSTTEFKLYGSLNGYANQNFQDPNGHPKWKLFSNATATAMIVAGVAEGIISMIGKRTLNTPKTMPYTEQRRGVTGNGAINNSLSPTGIGTMISAPPGVSVSSPGTGGRDADDAQQNAAQIAIATQVGIYNTFLADYYGSGVALQDALSTILVGFPQTLAGINETQLKNVLNTQANAAGIPKTFTLDGVIEMPKWAYLPTPLRVLGGLNQLLFYFAEGADVTAGLIYALLPFRQYALQQVSHGFYSGMSRIDNSLLKRFKIDDAFYLRDAVQNTGSYQNNAGNYNSYVINNLKRSDSVFIKTKSGPYYDATYPDGTDIGPNLITTGFQDKSLVTLGTIRQNNNNSAFLSNSNLPTFKEGEEEKAFSLKIASHYGAIKGRIRNQYGQLGSVFQLPVTTCEQDLSKYNVPTTSWNCPINSVQYYFKKITRSPIIFGGDTYINRYTEKNNMMFFYNWLYQQPDGFEYNYYLYNMIPNARFKVNSIKYSSGDLASVIDFNNLGTPGTGALPSAFYNMDYYVDFIRKYNYDDDTEGGLVDKYKGLFGIKEAYMYLANSGIRDFFVESEVIIDFRKQGSNRGAKHYDPYRFTDYVDMFDMDPDVMGRISSYLYDYSLSVSKLYNQYFSLGSLQNKYYDPLVSELCYTYYPDRIIYSLPQQIEAIKDSWFVYLVNNYKEFQSQLSGVKSVGKTGMLITFKNASPLMMQGVDQREDYLGAKITIGDGGLFATTPQNVTNADKSYEYGSSQNRLSVISTPAGMFYMSQDQGRVFSYGEGLQEISQAGMKWWFLLYLPYRLTVDFPEYPYTDNPVAGIGCQSTYDSSNSILYFCKKDFYLKDEFKGRVEYVPVNDDGTGDYFKLDGRKNSIYRLGDPYIFEDASWTVSYDPKSKFWISFHEWHPDLLLPTKDIFLSTKKDSIWKHNYLCDSYCNFYNEQYGCELEFPIITGQNVMTTRSMEYVLECYRRRSGNCVDQHHVLDYNFDRAIVYNSEQVSGYLNLNIYPKNNINESLKYPKLNANLSSYDILFSKEEQKYRFNQFWDITKNRGEFPENSKYPSTGPVIPGTTVLQGNYSSENTWITSQDGHTRILNPNNLDYNKSEMDRKKFRHYLNFLNLRREQCDDVNMIIKLSNSKNQFSQR